MKSYKTLHLIKSEDLNVHKTLFAARAAAWFVEAGYVAAACTHGHTEEVVCISVHGISFTKPVYNGEILTFTSRVVHAGTSSLTVSVEVTSEIEEKDVLLGFATFVTIDDETGKKKPHGIKLDVITEDEKEFLLRLEAEKIIQNTKKKGSR